MKNWPQILTAHKGWLSAVVFARVRDYDAVDEVLQETALAAVASSSLKEIGSDVDGESRWLYRVAIRQAMLYRRKCGRNQRKNDAYRDLASARNGAQSRADNPLVALMATEKSQLVRMAMERLSNSDREILFLKYLENWSCKEMAQRLGVGESAIKSRLLRSRKNLRVELIRLDCVS